MSIEELVKKYLDKWRKHPIVSPEPQIRAALTEQAETHAIELRAYEATVQNLEQRIRELEAQRVPEGRRLVPTRCPLCEYQHGHRIGCDNNPVDIALRDAAAAPKEGK